MGITVVATFMNLTEAQVAASALASGGLHPLVMDQGFGSVVWVEQAALQGYRLAVPSEEAVDAVAFFKALPRAPPSRRPTAPRSAGDNVRSNWWRVVGGLLGVIIAPALGWLIVGLRPKPYRRRHAVTFDVLLAAVAALLIVAALFVTALELLVHIPPTVWIVSPLVVGVLVAVLSDRRRSPPET